MTRSVPVDEVRPFGDRALLIGVDDARAGRRLAAALGHALGGADVEVVGGVATVGVVARDPDAELGALRAVVHDTLGAARAPDATDVGASAGRLVTIPCAFDGPDLAEVAALAGRSGDEVVALLTSVTLTVSVVGFSPGFAYLDGLPAPLRTVPRRDRPRPVVPAGSVALANGHAAVYPTPSPGGWQLVGRTGFPLFSLDGPPYAALAPGDRVRFAPAGAGDPLEPRPDAPAAWSAPHGARLVLEVLAPGLRAVVQDAGRRGVAPTGVPAAGPADAVSGALANGLAGNAPGAGALECTGGGTRLRALGPCHVAVVGAAPEVRVDGTEVGPGRLVPLAEGQVLEIGVLRRGCRTYVAVAGGLLGPEVFGSQGSDELCGLGPGPLGPGALLWAGAWAPPLGDHLAPGAATELPAGAGPVELRVVRGPHAERFDPGVLDRLAATTFRVGTASNRVGLRLEAQGACDWRVRVAELDSQPMVTGAVQLPPNGEPVVLLPDHATLGGYPVPGVVIAADHGLLGQCGPGTVVRLVPVGSGEAEEALRERRRATARAVMGHYPLAAG
ncbi:MAG TPA: carboxyltransferase domain-containing protein [Acidimicrobiales bacterium]|nr:carboxyltransferase domain-containing protein [Acidimicrobiales bacterium]